MANINHKPKKGKVISRTICEVHREIYRHINKMRKKNEISEKNYELISKRLEEAFDYGKKMNNKLRQYKNDYDADWWEMHKFDGGDLK